MRYKFYLSWRSPRKYITQCKRTQCNCKTCPLINVSANEHHNCSI
jgi:hypothetical protein